MARVVAIIAETESARTQVGSGYLLDAARVLTARHCAIDSETGRAPVSLTVVRAIDGAAAAVKVDKAAPDLDVALLAVIDDPPWEAELPDGSVSFGRVDRERTGELYGCEAEGFPRWRASEIGGFRDIAEVHGVIRATEGRERQRLVLRDPVLGGVAVPDGGLAWAGFSGAAVFHGGLLIGVVVEQYVLQGDISLQIRPVEAIAKAGGDAERQLAEALGIGRAGTLQLAAGQGRWRAETAGESALAEWGWSLDRDREGVRHWRPRARGVSIDSERGWRFCGRNAALTRIVSWLDRPRPDGKVLVVTGSPGAGKSAVLGRVVTTADGAVRAALPSDDKNVKASVGSVNCAVHAKGKTALDVAREVARAAYVTEPAEPRDLAPAVRDALDGQEHRRFNVVIDALDEAASPAQTREIITEVMRPLAETCFNVGVQVLVGTRRRDDGGDILRRFPTLDLLDLDDLEYFKGEDLAAYALACLQLLGDERDGNPYTDERAAVALAARIERVSGQNFLIAGLIARSHALRDAVATDPSQLDTPETVRSALDGYLKRLPGVGGLSARRLLTALAFAEEPGLTADLWKLTIETLPPGNVYEDSPVQVHTEQLHAFARSSAANFLVEAQGGPSLDGSSERSYRLFHRALGEALLAAREEDEVAERTEDEEALTNAFLETGRASGWKFTPAYLLRSLSVHAGRAGLVGDLLADDAYLLHADLRRLLQVVSDNVGGRAPATRDRARLLSLTPQVLDASPAERAALLGVTEALENLGDTYREDRWQAPWHVLWAVATPRHAQAICRGHPGAVLAACAVQVERQVVLATGSNDRTVRLWDPGSGEQVGVLEGHPGAVLAVCAVEMGGRALLAAGGSDGSVRLWDPGSGEQVRVFEGHQYGVRGVCAVEVDGQNLLVTGSNDRTVRLWDPGSGEQVRVFEGHQYEVRTVCAVEMGGRALLAAGGSDGSVRLWDPGSGEQVRVLKGPQDGVWAACAVEVNGRNLLAVASTYKKFNISSTEAVRLWDPSSGEQVRVLESHGEMVWSVCAVEVEGRGLLAAGVDDGTVRLWDPSSGERVRVLEGHENRVEAVCVVEVNGQDLLATGSADRTARLWNLSDIEQAGTHADPQVRVSAVCAVEVEGRELLVTAGSRDGSVRLWDPFIGKQVRVLKGHESAVPALCAVEVNGRELLVTADSRDGSVRLWDPGSGEQVRVLKGPQGEVSAVCAVEVEGRNLLAAAVGDDTAWLWDPGSGEHVRVLDGNHDGLFEMCAVEVEGRNLLAMLDGFDEGTVRLWDPSSGEQVRVLESHGEMVWSVCAVEVEGRGLLAAGVDDGAVRLWDPCTGKQVRVLEGHTENVYSVCAVEVEGRHLLAASDGLVGVGDSMVRLWDPRTGACLAVVPTYHYVESMAAIANSLAIGLDNGILVIRPNLAR